MRRLAKETGRRKERGEPISFIKGREIGVGVVQQRKTSEEGLLSVAPPILLDRYRAPDRIFVFASLRLFVVPQLCPSTFVRPSALLTRVLRGEHIVACIRLHAYKSLTHAHVYIYAQLTLLDFSSRRSQSRFTPRDIGFIK